MAKEQRRNPRFECTGTAGIQIAAGKEPKPARIVNLSAGGCLLVFKEPQSLLQDTTVELTFRINDLMLRALGRVRAIRSDAQIGFQFQVLSDRVRKRIEDLIEQLIEDFLTRGPLGSAGERRHDLRIGCTGTAGVQLAAGEVFYPAKIVNLSAGGCMMVLQKPRRLSQDMVVELAFQINSLPFQVRGQAKAIRSDTRIGFQFPLLSKSVRRQLEGLVDELILHIVRRIAERSELT